MLNITTQTAIAVLQDIDSGDCLHTEQFSLSDEARSTLFGKLEAGKIIRLSPGKEGKGLLAYELTRPLCQFSLLDVLQAIGEPINCNRPTPEAYYLHHGPLAQKIGVLNHMTRLFLSEIKITDW